MRDKFMFATILSGVLLGFASQAQEHATGVRGVEGTKVKLDLVDTATAASYSRRIFHLPSMAPA